MFQRSSSTAAAQRALVGMPGATRLCRTTAHPLPKGSLILRRRPRVMTCWNSPPACGEGDVLAVASQSCVRAAAYRFVAHATPRWHPTRIPRRPRGLNRERAGPTEGARGLREEDELPDIPAGLRRM